MPSTKQTLAPSSPHVPELNDVLEIRFKLSGDSLSKLMSLTLSLTKLISLALSLALGSAGMWGYLQSRSTSTPTNSPGITTEISP